jgi:DNA-binding transcriptional LysR family regulator
MQNTVDLKRLKLFRQVVECGGLSAAETVLNINLPTISAHLAALEAQLGMRLCDRGRKGFRLTAQGRSVLDASARLFESVENFRSEIGDLNHQLSGILRLGLVDNTLSDPACPVVPSLRALRSRSCDLEVSIDIRNPFELERALLEERIDIAVGTFNVTDPALEQHAIHSERLSLYIGQGHALFDKKALQLGDLAGADCVMRGYLRESQVVQQHVSFNYSATAQSIYELQQAGMHALQIHDFGVPDAQAQAVWRGVQAQVLARLHAGESVLVHCAAGLGRTGTMVAVLLKALGDAPGVAIDRVRGARPGTMRPRTRPASCTTSTPVAAEQPEPARPESIPFSTRASRPTCRPSAARSC